MSLCDHCRHGFIFERATGHRRYLCDQNKSVNIPSDVVSCSMFETKYQPELWDLREISWKIEVGPNGRIKGFHPPPKDE